MEIYVDKVSLPQVKYIRNHIQCKTYLKIPCGPVISAPKDLMRESYSKQFDTEDSSPCEITEF